MLHKINRFRALLNVFFIGALAGLLAACEDDNLSLTTPPEEAAASGPSTDEVAAVSFFAGDIIQGDPDASVTIIEYASLTCGHCATFHKGTYKMIIERLVETGQAKFVLREFPLDGIAARGAMMARCAGRDGYLDVVSYIFDNQLELLKSSNPAAKLEQFAETLGVENYQACIANEDLQKLVLGARQQGTQQYDVNSTPTLIINGEKYTGPRDFLSLSQYISGLTTAE